MSSTVNIEENGLFSSVILILVLWIAWRVGEIKLKNGGYIGFCVLHQSVVKIYP